MWILKILFSGKELVGEVCDIFIVKPLSTSSVLLDLCGSREKKALGM